MIDRVPALDDLAAELSRTYDGQFVAAQLDLASDSDLDRLPALIEQTGLPLKTLALVAAVIHEAVSVDAMDMDVWDNVMRVNLRANVKIVSVCAPLMRAAGGGAITLVTSFWGREGHGFFSPYCASKAALISYTQAAAAELAPEIRVNSVAPGNINTPMHFRALSNEAEKRGVTREEVQAVEWGKIPMGRPAHPEEIAAAIHFLSTDEAGYFVGATLDVNGGCGFY